MLRIFIILFITPIMVFGEDSNSRIDQLDQRLSDLELKSILNKFNFSGSFLNHVESYKSDNEDIDSSEKYTYVLNPVLLRVGLNVDAQVTNKINFYSTIGMSKFWNQSGRTPEEVGTGPQYESMKGGYSLSGSEAYFDTAYILYRFTDNFSLALGRMTTNNGPPIEQVEGVTRSGTYPRFGYNAIFDGLGLIYNASKLLPKNHSLKLRLFYTPFVYIDENKRHQEAEDESSEEQIEALQSQTALLTEYSYTDSMYFEQFDIFYMLWNYESFYEEAFQDDEDDDAEYASATSHALYLGVKKILKTGLSFSYTYYTFKERFDGLDDESSFNYLVNLNYEFSSKSILGFEYINTDDIFYLEDHNSLYISEFYTRHSNNGYHLYVTKPIGVNQILSLGYFNYKAGITDWNEEYVNIEAESMYLRWKVYF